MEEQESDNPEQQQEQVQRQESPGEAEPIKFEFNKSTIKDLIKLTRPCITKLTIHDFKRDLQQYFENDENFKKIVKKTAPYIYMGFKDFPNNGPDSPIRKVLLYGFNAPLIILKIIKKPKKIPFADLTNIETQEERLLREGAIKGQYYYLKVVRISKELYMCNIVELDDRFLIAGNLLTSSIHTLNHHLKLIKLTKINKFNFWAEYARRIRDKMVFLAGTKPTRFHYFGPNNNFIIARYKIEEVGEFSLKKKFSILKRILDPRFINFSQAAFIYDQYLWSNLLLRTTICIPFWMTHDREIASIFRKKKPQPQAGEGAGNEANVPFELRRIMLSKKRRTAYYFYSEDGPDGLNYLTILEMKPNFEKMHFYKIGETKLQHDYCHLLLLEGALGFTLELKNRTRWISYILLESGQFQKVFDTDLSLFDDEKNNQKLKGRIAGLAGKVSRAKDKFTIVLILDLVKGDEEVQLDLRKKRLFFYEVVIDLQDKRFYDFEKKESLIVSDLYQE